MPALDDLDEMALWRDAMASPFWAAFSAYVTHEWGPSGLRYQQAVRAAAKSADAVVDLQKVLHTQEAILVLMRYPADRLQALKAHVHAHAGSETSRRGPGL